MGRDSSPYTDDVIHSAKCCGSWKRSGGSFRKKVRQVYNNLSSNHVFYPVVIETLGVLADEAHEFITDIGESMSISALLIRVKLHFYTSAFPWQSIASTRSACPRHFQFLSPHCSHSRHFTFCLIFHTFGIKYQGQTLY